MENLQKTLSDIQRKIKVPKNQKNTFGGYNYRSCEDITEAVKKILPEGVYLTLNDELVQVGDRYYVKATATLTDGESSITTTAYARESLSKKGMDESQITGASSSYARKYALNGLLLIDDTKDADAQDNTKEEKKPVDNKARIVFLLKALDYNTETKESVTNAVRSLTQLDLLETNYGEIVSRLEVLLAERNEHEDK